MINSLLLRFLYIPFSFSQLFFVSSLSRLLLFLPSFLLQFFFPPVLLLDSLFLLPLPRIRNNSNIDWKLANLRVYLL